MALTCNSFSANTIGTTQQTVACLGPKVVNIIESEIQPEQFLLLVIDMLNRMAGAAPPIPLSEVQPCDVAEALRLAYCATHDITPVFGVNTPQLQGIILTMMNEALCA
jgi:hypothetical protein